jgi:vancomycin permeability regulator SanA
MQRLLNFIFQLIAAAVFMFVCTTAWIVFDGLRDQGARADSALVIGHSELAAGAQGEGDHAALDRAISLYNDKAVDDIIVANTASSSTDQVQIMAKYLKDHGIPYDSIIEVQHGNDLQQMGLEVADILKTHTSASVIIVAPYYDIDPVKLALVHENITQIGKAHVGKLQKEDALNIGREAVAFYAYVGKVYLMPAAEKVKQEAQVGIEKAKVDADQAKDRVNKGLDNMSK